MSTRPTPFGGLTGELIEELITLRTAKRHEVAKLLRTDFEEAGACWLVAEEIGMRYHWYDAGGCYIDADGSHAAHDWNILPDGRIFDATADQWGEPAPGIRITAADDPRYDGECPCDGSGPFDEE